MSTPELDTRFTERVVARELQNVREGGKPFACLIVRDGKVLKRTLVEQFSAQA